MDPVPDPLLLRKSGSAGDRTQDLCICSQKLRPLDHRGGLYYETLIKIENKTMFLVLVNNAIKTLIDILFCKFHDALAYINDFSQ